jgi:hypothetical protein
MGREAFWVCHGESTTSTVAGLEGGRVVIIFVAHGECNNESTARERPEMKREEGGGEEEEETEEEEADRESGSVGSVVLKADEIVCRPI